MQTSSSQLLTSWPTRTSDAESMAARGPTSAAAQAGHPCAAAGVSWRLTGVSVDGGDAQQAPISLLLLVVRPGALSNVLATIKLPGC